MSKEGILYDTIPFMKNIIYFDNAATTYPKPQEVLESQNNFYKEIGGNPGRSGHRLSIKAGEIIEDTRDEIASLINAEDPLQVAFTFNASHALNLAVWGVLKEGDRAITSTLEHNSVARPLRRAENILNIDLDFVRCDHTTGLIDLEDLETKLKKRTKLVTICHGSNVSGTIQPLKEIGELARKHGALLLTDAAQTAGTFPIDVREMNVDMLAFTGHKGLYGPMGTGGIYVRPGIRLDPVLQGGTGSRSEYDIQPEFLPDLLETGTPNAGGLAGLAAGIRFVKQKGVEHIHNYEKELARQLIEGLKEIPGIRYIGIDPTNGEGERLGVVSFFSDRISVSELGSRLDEEFNILTRVGLHCAPWAHKTFGTFPEGCVRSSFSLFNTKEEVDEALRAIKSIAAS